jgi:beta-N-acetylhexosaminidase
VNGIAELARGVVFAGIDRIVETSSVPSFGGYVLFGRDDPSIDDVHRLTAQLRERCAPEPPPIIAIDQEGGRVVRLRRGVEPMPSMMALGAAGDLELAARAGEQVAFDLRRAGCTMIFAPVLDLALHARNTAIGTRSLGSDPGRVGELAAAYARGLERGGIVPCYKHFPGHGDTSDDSHETVPVVDADIDTLRRRDLAPFARVAAEAPAIMLAHVIVSALDENCVASASERIAGDMLRGLGFTGIAITDCLTMAGAGDSAQAAVSALAAGADAAIVSRPWDAAEAAVDAIVRAVAEERLTLERLSDAYERVLRVRAAASDAIAVGEFPPHPGVGREIARRAVTLVRGLAHADPLTSAVLSFEGTTADGVVPDDVRRPSLSAEAPALAHVALPIDPLPGALDDAFALLSRTGRRPIVLARRAHLHDRQAGAIASIVARYPDALIVSALEPFDVPLFASAQHVVACYGDDAAAIGGLADVLFANTLPEGRLPVELSR